MNPIKINPIYGPKYTPSGEKAFNTVKKATKREVITFNKIIPPISKELAEKKNYMQTDEFWKDPHNEEMVTLSNKLVEARDNIAAKISENNETGKEPLLAQGFNGFTRIKKYLDISPELNNREFPTFHTKDDLTLVFTRMKMHNQTREIKNELGR